MSGGPTRGATEDRAWRANPGQASALRAVILLGPLVASLLITRLAAPGLLHPPGWSGWFVFGVQTTVIGSAVAVLTSRALRQLLPLAGLMNMTLVFPDHAPSRFGLALSRAVGRSWLPARAEGN